MPEGPFPQVMRVPESLEGESREPCAFSVAEADSFGRLQKGPIEVMESAVHSGTHIQRASQISFQKRKIIVC